MYWLLWPNIFHVSIFPILTYVEHASFEVWQLKGGKDLSNIINFTDENIEVKVLLVLLRNIQTICSWNNIWEMIGYMMYNFLTAECKGFMTMKIYTWDFTTIPLWSIFILFLLSFFIYNAIWKLTTNSIQISR